MENVPFVFSGPVCNGNENSLFQCRNDSNLAFGEINRYRGEADDMRNTAGVRCERKLPWMYACISVVLFYILQLVVAAALI